MKKSIYEKFLDFKKRHNLSNEEITAIATDYANSSLELARSYFSEKYGISKHVFYKARDYAIIFCLVDQKTYDQIKIKSGANYSSNNVQSSNVSSRMHFSKLLNQRVEFFNSFTEKEIIDIGHKYTSGVSLKNIAIAYDTGEFAIQHLLKKGTIELIYDATMVTLIGKFAEKSGFDKILQKREVNKKLLLDCLQKQISFLESQILCYNLFFRNSSNKPTLEDLKNEVKNAIKMYNETLKL